MTPQELEEIRKRVDAAVPGPWFPCGARYTYISRELSDLEIEDVAEVCNHYRDETQIEKNKQFIAHARTDIPALLEYIDSLHKQIEEAMEIIDFYSDVDSWGHESPASTTYSVIDKDDLGDGSFHFNEITDDERVGGKRARVYLAKYKDGDND